MKDKRRNGCWFWLKHNRYAYRVTEQKNKIIIVSECDIWNERDMPNIVFSALQKIPSNFSSGLQFWLKSPIWSTACFHENHTIFLSNQSVFQKDQLPFIFGLEDQRSLHNNWAHIYMVIANSSELIFSNKLMHKISVLEDFQLTEQSINGSVRQLIKGLWEAGNLLNNSDRIWCTRSMKQQSPKP